MNSLKLASGETIEVTSEEIIAAQAENGTLKLSGEQVSERAEDAYSNTANEYTNGEPSTGTNLAPTGSIVVNGVEVPVSLDMLVTRLNPSAENVTTTYRDVTIDSTLAEIYDVTFGAIDRSAIMTNKENAVAQLEAAKESMEEYHERLNDDPNISDDDAKKIIEADNIALNSIGDGETNKQIEKLLSETSISGSDSSGTVEETKPIEEMTAEEREAALLAEVNEESLGITQDTSTVVALESLRASIIDLNYQIALYDVELDYIDEVSIKQDSIGREAVRYNLLSPFDI
ncbi:hypothetical protein OZ415_10120 (plasmid) [Aerococcus urinaeequi]|uniref:Uncharacterized protein n=1 Tax=Aerococcus urinaeequi TaxID=51665 RepID=A0AA47GD91_9LACT|nr:hypothetical protein [Aerococcus urinaeequi]WAT25580.1 hypothetical protein OZ415_10120 [Aerococcus urinaeequi]